MKEKACIPIVIGVTGHRQLCRQDEERLHGAVIRALQKIKALCPHSPLLMLCSLAEGGDLLCADAGEELGSAAQAYLDETLRTAEDIFARRRAACLLMVFGAVYGLIGIPAAFESVKNRLLLILPVLHCLACAAGAEQILWKLGRGLSYSCLAVMAFALLQLLISRPKKKKRRPA